MTQLLPWLAIFAGFIGLIWSADRFIDASAAMATNFGASKLLIGLTIVAFGTSAPEVVVSINAAINNAGDIAIGNALGSNLANIGLVLGITLLITPLLAKRYVMQQEVPIMLAIMAISGVFLYNHTLSRTEGMALVSLMLPLLAWLFYKQKTHPEEETEIESMATPPALLWFIIGLTLLVVSAKSLVWGATEVAQSFGISQLVIGLTIVAVGTSLPELAASVMSARKGHHDMALGNIIGSNIFNLLLVMGIPTIISPLSLEGAVFSRDFAAMLVITLILCAAMIWGICFSKNSTIGRLWGAILLLFYVGYYFLLV